jgi:hypothetical protein
MEFHGRDSSEGVGMVKGFIEIVSIVRETPRLFYKGYYGWLLVTADFEDGTSRTGEMWSTCSWCFVLYHNTADALAVSAISGS